MRTAILILGILALLIGLIWIGQGTGTINWPQSSFMISQIQWAYYGAALAAVGVILIWRGRRELRRVGKAKRAHHQACIVYRN
jgi:membrane protein implicated in regulation of membrane protease activity